MEVPQAVIQDGERGSPVGPEHEIDVTIVVEIERGDPRVGCLSAEEVHEAPGGGIVVRPWGERSFYAEDPWHNPLCFVEDGTVYGG